MGRLKLDELPAGELLNQSLMLVENAESSYKITGKQLLDQAAELPTVTSEDEGKVLQVNSSGEWVADVFEGLPATTSADEDKILIVDQNGEWVVADIPNQLPTVTSEDEGKLLQVNSSGVWVAVNLDGNNDQF